MAEAAGFPVAEADCFGLASALLILSGGSERMMGGPAWMAEAAPRLAVLHCEDDCRRPAEQEQAQRDCSARPHHGEMARLLVLEADFGPEPEAALARVQVAKLRPVLGQVFRREQEEGFLPAQEGLHLPALEEGRRREQARYWRHALAATLPLVALVQSHSD